MVHRAMRGVEQDMRSLARVSRSVMGMGHRGIHVGDRHSQGPWVRRQDVEEAVIQCDEGTRKADLEGMNGPRKYNRTGSNEATRALKYPNYSLTN